MFKANLHLIRHGQTDWNAKQLIQGRIETSLDIVGKQQAFEKGKELASFPIKAVYSSTMRRAQETATILAAYHGLEVILESALVEGCYGDAEGMTKEGFHSLYSTQITERGLLSTQKRLQHKIVPNAESSQEIADRVIPCLKEVGKKHIGSHIMIVTHGWVMRTLLAVLGGYDDRKIVVSNMGWVHLETDGENFSILNHQGIHLT